MITSKLSSLLRIKPARHYSSDLRSAFEEHFLVPDVLDTAPNEHLNVSIYNFYFNKESPYSLSQLKLF